LKKDFGMRKKLIISIVVTLFLCSINCVYASDEEDGFVMIPDETTPLLGNVSKKNITIALPIATMQSDKNKERQKVITLLDEYNVHDRKDSIDECLSCCGSLLRNFFVYDKETRNNQQMSVVVGHSHIIDFRNKKEEYK
jgi:hypothetical protein